MKNSDNSMDYLFNLLTSREVKSIDSTVFIAADLSKNVLPLFIDAEALKLLAKITGAIYPIALRGKCQAGKTTTLNQIAKISNFPNDKWLEVAKDLGGSTTEGIWLMAITFTNNDTLLLFDVQGTDRGADELTHKLIAFTDHICTKVVDVFRMPFEGFSNDYINALYCLAISRDSVQNLKPTSNKAILWTNCVLPKRSPVTKTKLCATPNEYQTELLSSSIGERAAQCAKARGYAEGIPVITIKSPPENIIMKISELAAQHQFIKTQIRPAIKQILKGTQPFTIHSHVINNGNSFVEYLNNVYTNIKTSNIDLPFCALPIIRSIAISALKEKKSWVRSKMEQLVSDNSDGISKISSILMSEIRNIGDNCIENFENELADLPKVQWNDQLDDLKEFVTKEIGQITQKFKPRVIEHFLEQSYPKLNQLCTLGFTLEKLSHALENKVVEIINEMEEIPFFQRNIEAVDIGYAENSLNNHSTHLHHIQENVESDWKHRMNKFKEQIYSTDPGGVDQVIINMIQEHNKYCETQYSTFGIQWKHFFSVETVKIALEDDNSQRSKIAASQRKAESIAEFNRRIGIIMSEQISVPEKYGRLKIELEKCLSQYYEVLPWPLNDQTIGDVDDELQKTFNKIMDALYTPAVKEQLKNDRMAQMEMLSKLRLDNNESLLWVYCVGCRRIFAGRTRGCVKVTCSHFNMQQGRVNTEYGCGLTFEWANAQPVPLANLPSNIWFANIEEDRRDLHVKNLISNFKERARRFSNDSIKFVKRFFRDSEQN